MDKCVRYGYTADLRGTSFPGLCESLIRQNYLTTQIYLGVHSAEKNSRLVPSEDEITLGEILKAVNFSFHIHSPHTVNLGRPELQDNGESIGILNNLQRQVHKLPGSIVVHMGRIGGLSDILEKLNNPDLLRLSPLLLENAAGQGTEYGWTLDQIVKLWEGIDFTNELGMCLDTMHAFGAGMCTWSAHDSQRLLDEYEAQFPQHLKLIHLNDSKVAFGSRVDRHAPLKHGYIWSGDSLEGLKLLIDRAAASDWDVISETTDPMNDLRVLQSLYQK